MIIVTSISPNHISDQLTAINSWKKLECSIFSLNGESEIAALKESGYEVDFVSTHRTLEYFTGKSLVSINAMIDFAIDKKDDLLIVNSDIIISHLPDFKNDGITIFSRFDFTNNYQDAEVYEWGFDMFYIPKHFLKIFTPTIYGMGNVFWDHSLPFRSMNSGLPTYWADGRFIYHKKHNFQWNFTEWEMLARFFQIEFKLDTNTDLGQMSANVLLEIKRRLIKIQ